MNRRKFLEVLAAAMNAAVGLLVAVPAFRFLTEPLRRKRREERFLRLAPLDSLTPGRPLRALVHADRQDAYMHHPAAPVGAVWLTRATPDADVRCLQVICPHLGCGIDYAADRSAFSCPCHASDFDASGRRRSGPSPRDMDQLPCRVTEPDESGLRWIEVQYTEFQTGLAEKRPLT